MSSLAASRADGYYLPPDYDPQKHGSLNQFRGQHPLRERAKKLDQGILVIRFEMPFNVWCEGCNHLIGKGVRFNAEKKQIGSYYSTKIWSFTMRTPCCSHTIEVQTDPKNTEYVIVKGGRRKAETWTAENAETIELPDRDEEDAVRFHDDPFTKLERGETDKRKGRELGARIAELYHDSNQKFKDDFALNKSLRQQNRWLLLCCETHDFGALEKFNLARGDKRHSDAEHCHPCRVLRKQEKERDAKRRSLGLSDDVTLLPESEEDRVAASLVQFGDSEAFTKKWQQKRRAIKRQSIFAPSALVKQPRREKAIGSLAAEEHNGGGPSSCLGSSRLDSQGPHVACASTRHQQGAAETALPGENVGCKDKEQRHGGGLSRAVSEGCSRVSVSATVKNQGQFAFPAARKSNAKQKKKSVAERAASAARAQATPRFTFS